MIVADRVEAADAGLGAAAEAEAALVGVARRQLRRSGDHHRHEVEQIAGDHEAPRPAAEAAHRVVAEKFSERVRAELDGAPPVDACTRQQLLTEVKIADDQDVGVLGHDDALTMPARQEIDNDRSVTNEARGISHAS